MKVNPHARPSIKKLQQDINMLTDCIKHWRDNAAGNTIDTSATSCALCNKYNQYGIDINEQYDYDGNRITDCIACPIYDKTKQDFCNGTPYNDAAKAAREYNSTISNKDNSTVSNKDKEIVKERFKEKSLAMFTFLNKLRRELQNKELSKRRGDII